MPAPAIPSISSGASTGPIQFGNVSGGNVGAPTWVIVLVVVGTLGVGLFIFLAMRNGK